MTFRMFNWIIEGLKAGHDLKLCYESSKKYSKGGIGRTNILDIGIQILGSSTQKLR